MKKIVVGFVLILSAGSLSAQNFGALNKILDKLESNSKTQIEYDNYKLEGKKFFVLAEDAEHSERHIIEFLADNKMQLIELIEDKQTKDKFSNIFNGDIVRNHNNISVRADVLEGEKIPLPKVYNLLLNFSNGYYYLVDINTGEKWLETKYLSN